MFLAGYAAYKYVVAAPPEFSAAYAQSVAILVLLTGVMPFILAMVSLRVINPGHMARLIIGLLVGLVACVGGYALFWTLFLASIDRGPPVDAVAIRGVGWGLAQGAIAVLMRR